MSLVSLGMGVSLTAGNTQTTGVVFRELVDTSVTLDIAVAYRRDEKLKVLHSFLDMFLLFHLKYRETVYHVRVDRRFPNIFWRA